MSDDITARARDLLAGPKPYFHRDKQAYSCLSELLAEVERLHTWDGLMSLLDEHWPDDIFPTLRDDASRDPGPRIVSLLRWVEQLNVEVENQRTRALDAEFELTMSRGGVQVRPMTETESNLMTQVLDLRRERAEALAEVERLRGALDRLKVEWLENYEYEGGDGGGPTGYVFKGCADGLRAVLRGDQ